MLLECYRVNVAFATNECFSITNTLPKLTYQLQPYLQIHFCIEIVNMNRENQPQSVALSLEQEFELCQKAIEIEEFSLEKLQETLIEAFRELMLMDNEIKQTLREK